MQAVNRASNSHQLRAPTDAAMSLAMELGFNMGDGDDCGEEPSEPVADELELDAGQSESDADGTEPDTEEGRTGAGGAGHGPPARQLARQHTQTSLATGGGGASDAGVQYGGGIDSVIATDVESDIADVVVDCAGATPGPASSPIIMNAAAAAVAAAAVAAAAVAAGGGGGTARTRHQRTRAGTATGCVDTGGSSNFEAAQAATTVGGGVRGSPLLAPGGGGGGLAADLALLGRRGDVGSDTGMGGRAVASSVTPPSPRQSLVVRTSAAPLFQHQHQHQQLQHQQLQLQHQHQHQPRSSRWSAYGPSPHGSGLIVTASAVTSATAATAVSPQPATSLVMRRTTGRDRGQSDGGESVPASPPPLPYQASPNQRNQQPASPRHQQLPHQSHPVSMQPLPLQRATSAVTTCTGCGNGMARAGASAASGGSMPQGCCLGARAWWLDVRLQLKLLWKVFLDIVHRKPWVLLVPLLMCCLFTGLGVFGVLFAADRYIHAQQDYAREAVASATANAISGQLEIATFAVMTMSAYLTQQPFCGDLDRTFKNLSSVILDWDDKQLVYQVQALPAAVLNYIFPPLNNPELEKVLIGRDLLEVPMYREDTLYQIRSRDQRLMLGPYALLEGFQGMFVTYPIFLPAPSATFDWGCGVQPHDCPPGVCWLPKEGLKLWGLATSVVSLDNMQADFRFATLSSQGYLYKLHQLPRTPNRAAIIAASDPQPTDPVTATVEKFNLVWVLEVSPAAGWVPAWRDPCIAAVVVGSCLVSLLVLWLLVTREKHNMLLQAMLPEKVIWRLQRGEQTVVEEFLDPVTILFSDIVSYTEVASQLTPLQVVRLLNELYTQFDLLCDKHEVYKVETIGDAFMAVAGCPTREEPIAAAIRMANMAQDMIAMVEEFTTRVGDEEMKVKIRIGLHSGPVVAGVIGQRMPRYCLFGDTVNTASRMETNSSPMCIHISAATASLLRLAGAKVVMPPRSNAKRAASTEPRPNAPPSPLRLGLPPAGGSPSALSLLGVALGGLPSGAGPGLASDAGGGAPAMASPPNLSLLLEQHDQQGSNGDMWHGAGGPVGGGGGGGGAGGGAGGPAPTAQPSRQSLIHLSDTAFTAGGAGVASAATGAQQHQHHHQQQQQQQQQQQHQQQQQRHVSANGAALQQPQQAQQAQALQPSGGSGVGPSPASRLWGGGAGPGRNVLPMLDRPMTLYGRGRTMIKGKGMMHTFWLQRKPDLPPAPAVPATTPAAAARGAPTGVGAARSRRPSAQRLSPFHPNPNSFVGNAAAAAGVANGSTASNGPAGLTAIEAVTVIGMASHTSQASNYVAGATTGGAGGGGVGSRRPSEGGGSTTSFVRRITNMTNGGLTPPSMTPAASGAGGHTGGYWAYGAGYGAAAATAAVTAAAGMDGAGDVGTAAQLPQSGLEAAMISTVAAGQQQGGLLLAPGAQCPSPLGRGGRTAGQQGAHVVHSCTAPSLAQQPARPRLQSAHAAPAEAGAAAAEVQAAPATAAGALLPYGTVATVLAAAVALGPSGQQQQQQQRTQQAQLQRHQRQQPPASPGLLTPGTSSATSFEDLAFPVTFEPPLSDVHNNNLLAGTHQLGSNSLASAVAAAAAFGSAAGASPADPLVVSSPVAASTRQLRPPTPLGTAAAYDVASNSGLLTVTMGSVSRRAGRAESGAVAGDSEERRGPFDDGERECAGGGGGGGVARNNLPSPPPPPLPVGAPHALGVDALTALAEDSGVGMDAHATFGHSTARLTSSTAIPRLGSLAAFAGAAESGTGGGGGAGASAINTSAGQFSFGLPGVLCSGGGGGGGGGQQAGSSTPGGTGPPLRRRQRLLAGLESVISTTGVDVDSAEDLQPCVGGSADNRLGGDATPSAFMTTVAGLATTHMLASTGPVPMGAGVSVAKADGSAVVLHGAAGAGTGGASNASGLGGSSGLGAALPSTRAVVALSGPANTAVVMVAQDAAAAAGPAAAAAAEAKAEADVEVEAGAVAPEAGPLQLQGKKALRS
ncbi:hypothetical protein HYH02_008472 [Chlamydomonas schloesseri]|uniref:Guanylate cyclase domain-containing protein n=1 Tax=Chlamydomonas schloesseri TaxID=2026947 RepID=A0A836B3B9_9CHLO|nr:hypothetical protein HYH02_008472 [Chlamydomonas schloesseri]|eukprot:KAG2446481.1 hypothetical protein HYH02_008472 [Chlamydomonas schloesseri]